LHDLDFKTDQITKKIFPVNPDNPVILSKSVTSGGFFISENVD
jgi:hypothetical protein